MAAVAENCVYGVEGSNKDVLWLDVDMEQWLLVEVLKRSRDGFDDTENMGSW